MNPLLRFFREHVWAALPERVSWRDRRTAGLAWPVFLVLIGGLLAWKRHRHGLPVGTASYVLFALAPLLGAALLASQAVGSAVYRAVMGFFLTFGFVISHLIMIVFFYLIVSPLALVMRLVGKDFIDTRPGHAPVWRTHSPTPERRRFYRLF